MALYGYARVSHVSQSLDVQIDALRAEGCTVIRSEKKSGTTTEGRVELQTLLDFTREGDTICVIRVDRIARSIADLQDILRVLSEHPTDRKFVKQFDEDGWFVTVPRNVRLSDVHWTSVMEVQALPPINLKKSPSDLPAMMRRLTVIQGGRG
jgi:Resolvase, N terminal domain